MANIQPVRKQTHGDCYWRSFKDLNFARGDTVAPLVLSELQRAASHLPIAFVVDGDTPMPVALQGFKPGENLLVAPDGKWRVQYIPSVYRGHPFSLHAMNEERHALCVDMDSGLVSEGPPGELFFDADGAPAARVKDVFKFLSTRVEDMHRTRLLCRQLNDAGLLVPWQLNFRHDDRPVTVEGLFRADEQALRDLDAEALKELTLAGGVGVVYCQLLSMQHIRGLVRLWRTRKPTFDTDVDSIDELFGNVDEVLEFGFD